MYAIGSLYKANKETIDGVQKTVDAHKQLLRVIKDFAVSAGWTVIDYKEDFEDFDDAYDDFEDNPEYWDDY